MEKTIRLGLTLVAEGLIDKEQLEKSLSIQETHPTKSIGEIISKLYKIPEGQIEAIFVKEILIPCIRNLFYTELSKKLTLPTEGDLLKTVPRIDVQVGKYKRITTATKTFTYKTDLLFEPSTDKHFLSRIDCTVASILLHTAHNKTIEFQNVDLEFDIPNQKITLENMSLIMEAKIKLNQILKKEQMAKD